MTFSGPRPRRQGRLNNDFLPGQLNYRLAGSFETRGSWTAFREEETQYWAAQLDYTPSKWLNLFLEYQDGYTRIDGIGSQWIYDTVNDAKDTEFRNEFDEAFNWARHVMGPLLGCERWIQMDSAIRLP
jgi:outer membrane receptor for ferric coprogen and ferric-rhodotorulic acid